jgi:ribosomal protein S18 acetylase RimI-like enzyme
VIAAIDGNPAAWFDLLAGQPRAVVGSCWVVTGVPFALCNSVFFPPASAAVVDEALAVGAVPQLWWLGSSPGAVQALLEERGVVVDEEELPGMARSLDAPLPVVESSLRIVSGALPDFATPFSAAYGIGGAALSSIMAAFGAYGRPDVVHFVGYEDAAPVACASIIVRDGVCGLYDVGTVAAARGRGFGTAMTVHALRAGARMGASLAVLHSSPMGMPIYRRLGFEVRSTARTVETRAP